MVKKSRGDWDRTSDLMLPRHPRYHCATPRKRSRASACQLSGAGSTASCPLPRDTGSNMRMAVYMQKNPRSRGLESNQRVPAPEAGGSNLCPTPRSAASHHGAPGWCVGIARPLPSGLRSGRQGSNLRAPGPQPGESSHCSTPRETGVTGIEPAWSALTTRRPHQGTSHPSARFDPRAGAAPMGAPTCFCCVGGHSFTASRQDRRRRRRRSDLTCERPGRESNPRIRFCRPALEPSQLPSL